MKTDAGYELTRAIMRTADTFLRESTRLFRPYGLSAPQYNVLNILAKAETGLSQRELSEFLVVDRSNVTGLLDRMEKAGWVARTDHPEDRRIYQVRLTASGRALWSEVQPRYLAVVAQVTHGIPAKRLQESLETLKHLEAGAAKWTLPPAKGEG